MEIFAHKGNIFDLLTDNTCDAIIVWVRGNATCIGTDWRIFRSKYPELEERFSFHAKMCRDHHSVPIHLNINGIKKYIYFLRNEAEEDCISDSRLVLQLISAMKILVSLSCTKIGLNGARPLNIKYGLPDDDTETRKEKAEHNNALYRERVDLIVDLLQSFHVQTGHTLSVHLISKNDVFINNIKHQFVFKPG